MKKLLLTATFAFTILSTTQVVAQRGFGTNTPDKSSAVDIVSTKRGLLIPRIALVDLNRADPVTSPATSLFVFNTNNEIGQGFYYWNGVKWVGFVSDVNQRDVNVKAAENGNIQVSGGTYDPMGVKNYELSIQAGNANQVLVTQVVDGVSSTVWIDPNEFIAQALKAGNGIGIVKDDKGNLEIKFTGTLTEATTITATKDATLSIQGLETITESPGFVMVLGEDGVVRKMASDGLVPAHNIKSDDGIILFNGESISAKTVLKEVGLSIAPNSIDPGKFKASADQQDMVPVVQEDGTVIWKDIPGTKAADINTDGKIVIGSSTDELTMHDRAVLRPFTLSIREGSIGPVDMSPGSENTVMVTDKDGVVSWTSQDAILKKDTYEFDAPLKKEQVKVNDAGGTDYKVSLEGQGLSSKSLTVSTVDNKALLQPLTMEITPGSKEGQVLTTTGTGENTTTSWSSVSSLVQVTNALQKDAEGVVELGGALIKPTQIVTSVDYTLAIAGLTKAPETAASIVVAQGDSGVLRTVEKTLSGQVTDIKAIAGYSIHTPEVFVSITLGNADQEITFPAASEAKGQVINISIANKDENHTGFLKILDTYGSMPYQGWIVKSNGTSWNIVGSN